MPGPFKTVWNSFQPSSRRDLPWAWTFCGLYPCCFLQVTLRRAFEALVGQWVFLSCLREDWSFLIIVHPHKSKQGGKVSQLLSLWSHYVNIIKRQHKLVQIAKFLDHQVTLEPKINSFQMWGLRSHYASNLRQLKSLKSCKWEMTTIYYIKIVKGFWKVCLARWICTDRCVALPRAFHRREAPDAEVRAGDLRTDHQKGRMNIMESFFKHIEDYGRLEQREPKHHMQGLVASTFNHLLDKDVSGFSTSNICELFLRLRPCCFWTNMSSGERSQCWTAELFNALVGARLDFKQKAQGPTLIQLALRPSWTKKKIALWITVMCSTMIVGIEIRETGVCRRWFPGMVPQTGFCAPFACINWLIKCRDGTNCTAECCTNEFALSADLFRS